MPQIGDIYNYHLKITLPNEKKPVLEESVYIMVMGGTDSGSSSSARRGSGGTSSRASRGTTSTSSEDIIRNPPSYRSRRGGARPPISIRRLKQMTLEQLIIIANMDKTLLPDDINELLDIGLDDDEQSDNKDKDKDIKK